MLKKALLRKEWSQDDEHTVKTILQVNPVLLIEANAFGILDDCGSHGLQVAMAQAIN